MVHLCRLLWRERYDKDVRLLTSLTPGVERQTRWSFPRTQHTRRPRRQGLPI
jgi:hypothetical protein